MNIRKKTEEIEIMNLSKFASKSKFSKGRKIYEEPCDIRTCYQRDRDRIIHSKAFRRLMHKTQVFIELEGDHYRTRLTHTIEVSQVARTIAMALNLNEDLTEAIALGHDLGHTPFGHLGEDALNGIMKEGFHHNEQSIRVLDLIEKNGKGLNLTYEVLDGILNHRGGGQPSTLEGMVVQISDKITYVNHDIDDALRAGILTQNELPDDCTALIGNSSRSRIDFLIRNIIENSKDKNVICMDKKVKNMLYKLRGFLFDNVYSGEFLEKEREVYKNILTDLYNFYINNYEMMPAEFIKIYKYGEAKERVICDYIAGMTDPYAIKLYNNVIKKSNQKKE